MEGLFQNYNIVDFSKIVWNIVDFSKIKTAPSFFSPLRAEGGRRRAREARLYPPPGLEKVVIWRREETQSEP